MIRLRPFWVWNLIHFLGFGVSCTMLSAASNLLNKHFIHCCPDGATIPALYFLFVFSTQRTIRRRTHTMGGQSSSPLQDAFLNIMADILPRPSFLLVVAARYRKMHENHVDVGKPNLEYTLNIQWSTWWASYIPVYQLGEKLGPVLFQNYSKNLPIVSVIIFIWIFVLDTGFKNAGNWIPEF